jgi:tetratricopeptide (TPR) repeat protein
MNRLLLLAILARALTTAAIAAEPSAEARAARTKAYELYDQKQYDQAAEQFQKYLAEAPEDFTTQVDYAGLLSQLDRHARAARVLEAVHEKQPQNEAAWFKLGVIYLTLKRLDDAEKAFAALEKSTNADMAAAARDALVRLREERNRETRYQAEENIYKLAAEFKHDEVIREVEKLERSGPPSYGIEMQRLYSMVSLKQYAQALERANRLEEKNRGAADLEILRADLYNQLGQRPQAEAIWRQVEREHAGTPSAAEAKRRLAEKGGPTSPEDRVYALARQQKHREVAEAINDLERKGPLSPAMELQRLYAWQSLGETRLALEHIDSITKQHPGKPELALIHADLLINQHRWQEASTILKEIKAQQRDTPLAVEAQNRLAAIPEIANLDKWYWGEAYLSGDYLGRFGTVIGSGFARHGYYIPEVRWLQPYAEMRFSADTRSGAGGRGTIITDNFIGFYGGMRAQLLPTEYLFIYGQGGVNKDFLDRREEGDWALDYQAGIYGFKSWGPGTILRTPSQIVQTGANVPAAQISAEQARKSHGQETNDVFWRGDWFVDAGADFSYYHRYSSWIGYGQGHEGFRLWQFGPSVALDAYAVENVSWDVRGNFYDNLFEIGPGLRLLWVPRKRWEVVLRTEWLAGFYFGRDELGNRGNTSSTYDGVHVGLSVGARW